ncbi:30S ribosomal protein S27e [Candidatus Micrarchaeota archaeon]|nr:30S ribosomal protein S27e [Candidatus Micrarchaeota archaeon]
MGSRFLLVKCSKCGNEQVIFSNATSEIKCSKCGHVLTESTGSRAKVVGGKVIKIF